MTLLDWIDEFEGDPDYEFDKVAIEVGEQIVARMEELGMTQADLAREMGVTRARVSQILRGNDNLTLKSIVAVAIGLGSRVDFHLREPQSAAIDSTRLAGRGWPIIDRAAPGEVPSADRRLAVLANAA